MCQRATVRMLKAGTRRDDSYRQQAQAQDNPIVRNKNRQKSQCFSIAIMEMDVGGEGEGNGGLAEGRMFACLDEQKVEIKIYGGFTEKISI